MIHSKIQGLNQYCGSMAQGHCPGLCWEVGAELEDVTSEFSVRDNQKLVMTRGWAMKG